MLSSSSSSLSLLLLCANPLSGPNSRLAGEMASTRKRRHRNYRVKPLTSLRFGHIVSNLCHHCHWLELWFVERTLKIQMVFSQGNDRLKCCQPNCRAVVFWSRCLITLLVLEQEYFGWTKTAPWLLMPCFLHRQGISNHGINYAGYISLFLHEGAFELLAQFQCLEMIENADEISCFLR